MRPHRTSSTSTPTPNPTTTYTIFVTMSDGQTKQFGKGQRTVPAQKAQKWYPVDDESQPKKVSIPRKSTWTYIEKEIRTCIDCYGWMRHDIRVCGLK
jgi:hypothetical protein